MNEQPISQAHDNDLRLSPAALERAAKRARELAVQTGTELIFSRNGVIERVRPQDPTVSKVRESKPLTKE